MIKNINSVILGTVFVVLSAQLTIQAGPIPISAQSLAVLLVGYFLGSRLGPLAIALYILLGVLGLPVFADRSSGFAVLMGGSGGFIWGFILGAALLGFLAEKKWGLHLLKAHLAMLLGTVVIIIGGLVQLTFIYDFSSALEYGFYPFIWGAVIKIVLGALIVFAYEKYGRKTG